MARETIDSSRGLPNPERTSERLLKRLGIEHYPIDLNTIASKLDNVRIIDEDIDGPGYLLPLGRIGAEIIVRADDSVERKRFTIAHELGHWVLGITCEHKTGRFQQPSGVRREAVEKWCDLFAASLLMPRSALVDYFHGVDNSVFVMQLMNAPLTFRVSDEAMFFRVYEVLDIRVVYLRSEAATNEHIVRAFVPDAAMVEIQNALSIPRVRELLPLEVFSLRIEVGSARFLCAWQRMRQSKRVTFTLRPSVVMEASAR